MPAKIKFIHKCLTLVAVPLIFGISIVLLLYFALTVSENRFQRELALKDAMICDDVITRRITSARIGATLKYITKDEYFEKQFEHNISEAVLSFKAMQKNLKNEKTLQMPLQMLKDEILLVNKQCILTVRVPFDMSMSDVFRVFGAAEVGSFISERLTCSMMTRLQRLSAAETASTLIAIRWVQLIVVGGMIAISAVSVLVAIYFYRNITNRLLVIVNNTVRLSKGLPLSPPLGGLDEIAELDQFLYKSAIEIRQLERFKKEMIGVVSHELKTPLSTIAAFLSSLGDGVFGEISSAAHERVDRTSRSVSRLMSLLQEFLYLDRLELDMTRENTSVENIVTSSVDSIRELSEQYAVDLVVNVPSDGGGMVFVDRNRLVQVIVNLLSNALKFSPPEGRVTIQAGLSNGTLECRVSDQGRGIPEEFRKQIFDPFMQVETTDATVKKGTGLGLTIARSIVEQHGGKIGIDSVLGEGSTFWFKVPAAGDGAVSSNGGENSAPASTNMDSTRHRSGKFGILHKGLLIVAVPLIFQLTFVSIIGSLLYQIQEQIHLEQSSREIVNGMNRCEEKLMAATNNGLLYIYSQSPFYQRAWIKNKTEAFQLSRRVIELLAKKPEQLADVKLTDRWLHRAISILEKFSMMKLHDELGSASNLRQYLVSNSLDKELKYLFEGQVAQDRLIAREKSLAQTLAEQRREMIKTVQMVLWVGIILNIILTVCLALFLVRNFTKRLQHVMENTSRLVNRQPLELPLKGNDEIAFLDQSLYAAAKHLMELETFKKELISIVSHELRTPLLSISSALDLFEAGILGELSEKGSSRLHMVQAECDRLIRLINDLLDIEKMEAGKFILDRTEVNAADLVEGSTKAIAQLADAKNVTLETSIAADIMLSADRDRLSQVLINLLSNAVKFSPQNGTIKVVIESINSETEFRVIDEGRGIPEELRTKIFDRFIQVEEADATARGGSGLGLSIAKAIVEQHGGSIGVDSKPGFGSTFWFRIPT